MRRKLEYVVLLAVFTLLLSCKSTSENSNGDDSDAMPVPTATDLRILHRANELLSTEEKWSQHDSRECRPTDQKLSLFCALHRASIEETGTYRHRSAAMQEMRKVIENASRGRVFEHRLMDYNNLDTTNFSDIKSALKTAIQEVSNSLEQNGSM